MARLLRYTVLLSCLLTARAAVAATYYVDYVGGSDANNGTSKTTPWQHAPGMQTCTSVCASTTINAGDSIILKGGVRWPNASFKWNLPSGSSGSPTYIGVDKSWYTGASWTRPILTAGGAVISNNYNTMFGLGPDTTIDNFEITGFYLKTGACSGAIYGDCGIFNCGQHSGQTIEDLYIHGWTHDGTSATTNPSGIIFIFSMGGSSGQTAHDNVIVGTDVPGDHSANAFFNGPSTAYNNYIKQVSSAFIVSYPSVYHDNHIEDIGPAYCNMPFPQYAGNCTHENGFEDNGDTGLYFYNNVITNVNAGLALWVAPNPGYSVTMWNNIIYAVHDNQVLDLARPVYNSSYCSTGQNAQNYCNTSGNYVLENNTVECGDDTTLYDVCQSNVGFAGGASFLYQNNHLITATTAKGCASGVANCRFDATNIVQTLAMANGQGYSSSQAYAFSPTSSGNSTVGAGTALTSTAVGQLATLSSDTTYACAMGNGNQPSCPKRTAVSRPLTAAWDAGAYRFNTSGVNVVNPPANLSATVN
jgi:hypothetical protein